MAPEDPPSNFPTSLDNNTSLYLVEGGVTQVNDEHHNVLKNAIIAIETKLGIDNSAVTTTIDYMLKSSGSNNPGHTHSGGDIIHALDGAEHTNVATITEAVGDILLYDVDWKDGLKGWGRRKKHTMTGTTGGAQTNYQMRLKVRRTTGSDSGNEVFLGTNCRTDYGDIRFTSSNKRTQLDYWLESYSGDTAYFWVEVPSIPESPGTVDIYIYYDKSDATTTSDFDDTFVFGDPFDNTTLDTSRWPSVDGNPTYSIDDTNHYLEITDMDASEWDTGKGFHSPTTISLPSEWIVEDAYGAKGTNYTVYGATTTLGMETLLLALHHTTWSSTDYGISTAGIWDAWDGQNYFNNMCSVGGNLDYNAGAHATPHTETFRMYKLDGTIHIYEDTTERVSEANSETVDRVHIGIGRYSTNEFVTVRQHAFRIRNYASPEPTHTSWGTEETRSNLWTNLGKGTDGQVLKSTATNIAWGDTLEIQRGTSITDANGDKTVTFGSAFSSTPIITVTSRADGVVFAITAKSTSSFTVKARDILGITVDNKDLGSHTHQMTRTTQDCTAANCPSSHGCSQCSGNFVKISEDGSWEVVMGNVSTALGSHNHDLNPPGIAADFDWIAIEP